MTSPKTDNFIKCVVVGDGSVGKTCLLIRYVRNEFLDDYVPTVFENHTITGTSGDQPYNLLLCDTAGQEGYDRLRTLAYPDTDVFLICFSLVEPDSFENISDVWVPEIKGHCGENARFFLVGTKEDLRNDVTTLKKLQSKQKKPITRQQGKKLAKKEGANGYFECSALTDKGLRDVFNEAILAALEPKTENKPSKSNLFNRCICGS